MTVWEADWFSQKAEDVRRTTWIPWKSRKRPRRAILKDGHKNVRRKEMSHWRWWRYLQDIFTTLLDAQWRWTLQFLALEFFGCWLAFALIWWLIAFVHGDLHEDHLPFSQLESNWTPCILNIHGFHSAFLYSLETQHTTGYGLRVITEECPEAIFILVCQCLIGMTLDSFSISIIFAKLIRAKHATNTVQFSKRAVISRRDGKLLFMFRIGDLRRSRLAGAAIRAIFVKSRTTREGELLPTYLTELTLQADAGDGGLFLLWPTIVYHEIDDDSPLKDFAMAETSSNQKFEIFVILDATVESTGVSIEAKSSYLPSEILRNHKFERTLTFNTNLNCYEVNWGQFDKTRLSILPSGLNEEKNSESDIDPENEQLLFRKDPGPDLTYLTESPLVSEPFPFPVIDDDYFPPYEKPAGPDNASENASNRAGVNQITEIVQEMEAMLPVTTCV